MFVVVIDVPIVVPRSERRRVSVGLGGTSRKGLKVC